MSDDLKGKNILLGVSGGIAAYKAADLASKLVSAGAAVTCVMTESACKLVAPKTFEALTTKRVYIDLWSSPDEFRISHVNLVQSADVIVIAPATANIIGKIANGICDDLLSTTMCAAHIKPVLIAPAMNNNMWGNPAVRRNVATLAEMGYEMVGPGEGRLACGDVAVGRMSEPAEIIEKIRQMV